VNMFASPRHVNRKYLNVNVPYCQWQYLICFQMSQKTLFWLFLTNLI